MANSSFNEEHNWTIDSFTEMADFSSADVTNVLRYQSLKQKTSLTVSEVAELAQLLSPSGGGLENKILTPQDWNKAMESIVATQTYLKNRTQEIIAGAIPNSTISWNMFDADLKTKVSAIETKANAVTTALNGIGFEVRNGILYVTYDDGQ